MKIKCSKTDPLRRGVDVYLNHSFNKHCHMEAIVAYLTVRGKRWVYSLRDSPFQRGGSYPSVLAVGKDPTPYNGHSFRIRVASTATKSGVEDLLIKIFGRWRV